MLWPISPSMASRPPLLLLLPLALAQLAGRQRQRSPIAALGRVAAAAAAVLALNDQPLHGTLLLDRQA